QDVEHDVADVLRQASNLVAMRARRERVQVSDDEKTFVALLQLDAAQEGADEVSEVKRPRGAVAGEQSRFPIVHRASDSRFTAWPAGVKAWPAERWSHVGARIKNELSDQTAREREAGADSPCHDSPSPAIAREWAVWRSGQARCGAPEMARGAATGVRS